MQTKTWTRSNTITVLMVALFLAIMVFGCKNEPPIHAVNYTLRINGNASSFTLMDGNLEVSTFTDEKLDSIVLEDNQ